MARYRRSYENPLSSQAKTAIGIGVAVAVGLGIFIATRPTVAAKTTPVPPPPPGPPPPPPPGPPPPPPPLPPAPPAPPGVLSTGAGYVFALSAPSLDVTTIQNDLSNAGFTSINMTCLSGGICTGQAVWSGLDGASQPVIPGILWVSLLPVLPHG